MLVPSRNIAASISFSEIIFFSSILIVAELFGTIGFMDYFVAVSFQNTCYQFSEIFNFSFSLDSSYRIELQTITAKFSFCPKTL
jgi:hypothetical protein